MLTKEEKKKYYDEEAETNPALQKYYTRKRRIKDKDLGLTKPLRGVYYETAVSNVTEKVDIRDNYVDEETTHDGGALNIEDIANDYVIMGYGDDHGSIQKVNFRENTALMGDLADEKRPYKKIIVNEGQKNSSGDDENNE